MWSTKSKFLSLTVSYLKAFFSFPIFMLPETSDPARVVKIIVLLTVIKIPHWCHPTCLKPYLLSYLYDYLIAHCGLVWTAFFHETFFLHCFIYWNYKSTYSLEHSCNICNIVFTYLLHIFRILQLMYKLSKTKV